MLRQSLADAGERDAVDARFLRSVLTASGDCIKVLDLDGRLLFMSESALRVMEVADFGAIHGCPWPDLWQGEGHVFGPGSGGDGACRRDRSVRGPADTMAGNSRYWDVQVTPILGANGRPERLLSISRDITTIWRAEQALRDAEGMNAPILQSSRDCIVVLDLEARTMFVSPGGIASMEITDVESIIGLSC